MDYAKIVSEFIKLLDNLPEITKEINKEMSKADKRIAEIYHKIENENIDLVYACLVVNELKVALIKRRKIKVRHKAISIINNWKDEIDKLKVLSEVILRVIA